jgi:large subunit ribosomal protein LP0
LSLNCQADTADTCQIKEYLANPEAFAAAAPAASDAPAAAAEAAPEAAQEEEKEESDDDMGFGLFD